MISTTKGNLRQENSPPLSLQIIYLFCPESTHKNSLPWPFQPFLFRREKKVHIFPGGSPSSFFPLLPNCQLEDSLSQSLVRTTASPSVDYLCDSLAKPNFLRLCLPPLWLFGLGFCMPSCMVQSMRKLCPNLDRENGLETVLEVPIPEEMFTSMGSNAVIRWQNMRSRMRAQRSVDRSECKSSAGPNNEQFVYFLKIVGSSFIPFQAQLDHTVTMPIKEGSIEASTAKYIVQQYLAATGGASALDSVCSMYAVGQVKMVQTQVHHSGAEGGNPKRSCESGGFVLWQKNPDLWYLELVVSGCKVSAGSDGTVAWSQSSSNPSAASKGPPRPLRRFFQGLDPRSTANLFLNAVCIGEKTVRKEECFVLKLETSTEILKAQSRPNTDIVHHTIWGNFSQRTGLLIQFEDTKLVRMKCAKNGDNVFYETSMESTLEDYRYVDGINIAHSGKTTASIYRYGQAENVRWRVEETWRIEEVDFNICGLSMDCFLPPADVKKEQDHEEHGIGC